MLNPKNNFSKNNRISIRISNNDLNNLFSVKKSGDFKDDSEAIRFCITFSNIILNMLPAAIAESYIETAEETMVVSDSTARNEPEKRLPPSSVDD